MLYTATEKDGSVHEGKREDSLSKSKVQLILWTIFVVVVEICLIAPGVFVTKISQISSMVAHCQEQAGRQHA